MRQTDTFPGDLITFVRLVLDTRNFPVYCVFALEKVDVNYMYRW
jgi:hypothetical protein